MLKRRLLFIAGALLIMASGSYAQNSGQQTTKTDPSVRSDTTVYVCPMHTKVTSSMPGECSKCGMDLVLKKKQPVKRKATQSSAKQLPSKESLITAGEYNCCVKKPCDECFKDHASCSCYKNAQTQKTVCEECGAAWKRGEGNVPGVNPDSIKSARHKH